MTLNQPRSRAAELWIPLFPGVSLDLIMYQFRGVAGRYCAFGRYFHCLDHPVDLLLKQRLLFPDAPRCVLLALWLHDIVYTPGSPYSEEDSAMVAFQILTELGIPKAEIEEVMSYIIMTKEHLPTTNLEGIVSDLDMYSLGDPWEEYKAGGALIRKEYKILPKKLYVSGRKAFITKTLDHEHIYWDPVIRAEREDQARSNLKQEWSELGA